MFNHQERSIYIKWTLLGCHLNYWASLFSNYNKNEDNSIIFDLGATLHFKQTTHNLNPFNKPSNKTIGHTTSMALLSMKQLLEQTREVDTLPVYNTIYY